LNRTINVLNEHKIRSPVLLYTATLEGRGGLKYSVKSTSPSPPRPRTALYPLVQSPAPLRAIGGIYQWLVNVGFHERQVLMVYLPVFVAAKFQKMQLHESPGLRFMCLFLYIF
jgi:hypothetical protein